MVLSYTQLRKNMKQCAAATFTGVKSLSVVALYLLLAAAFLWLVHIVTAPVGGIVFFSAIFTVALVGFASAVVLFHALHKVSMYFK